MSEQEAIVWLTVGQIVSTQGLRGEVRVRPTTDLPEIRFAAGSTLFLQCAHKDQEELEIKTSRPYRAGWILHFRGWDDLDAAKRAVGLSLAAPIDRSAPLAEGEYYHHDIVGCRVVSIDGEALGEIVKVCAFPAHDLWVVREANGQEWMLPYHGAFVKNVDIARKIVRVELWEGLRPAAEREQ